MGVQVGFMGVQLGGKGHLGRFTGLWLRCGDHRPAAGGCPCASLMIKSRAVAAGVRPCARPIPAHRPRRFCRSCAWTGRRAGTAAACRLRNAGPAGPSVSAWSGDGSPIRCCSTTDGDRVPLRTLFRFIPTSVDLNFREYLTSRRCQATSRTVIVSSSGTPNSANQPSSASRRSATASSGVCPSPLAPPPGGDAWADHQPVSSCPRWTARARHDPRSDSTYGSSCACRESRPVKRPGGIR